MTPFSYQFENHPASKGTCPSCKAQGVYRYYQDKDGNRIDEQYGRCDRENACGYHRSPSVPSGIPLVSGNGHDLNGEALRHVLPDPEPLHKMLADHSSPFHSWCRSLGIPPAHMEKWAVSSRQNAAAGATEAVFIYKNALGDAVNAKIITYGVDGKRVKDRVPHYLKPPSPNEKYGTCLYGEHLLAGDGRPVCLVESEKTAVLASHLYQDYDWLATGSANGLTADKTEVLRGRKVYYLPDADQAGRKASSIDRLRDAEIDYEVVDLFPKRSDGYDLADAIAEGHRPQIVPSQEAMKGISTLGELVRMAADRPPQTFLWLGVKRGSFGFFFGPAKSGKTTLCEGLAIAIAAGRKTYLGWPLQPENNKVLFLSFEEFWLQRIGRNTDQLRVLTDHETKAVAGNFITVNENFPRLVADENDWKKIEHAIRQSEAKTVFIDSLNRLYSGAIEESGLAKTLSLRLREMTNRLGITLIVIHHSPKLQSRAINIDSLAGSRVLAQEADFMIGVNKTQAGHRYMKEVAYRYASENSETVYPFSISHGWIELGDEVPEKMLLKEEDGRQKSENTIAVLDTITELCSGADDKTVATGELLARLVETKVMSRATLHAQLHALKRDGRIESPVKGQWKAKSDVKSDKKSPDSSDLPDSELGFTEKME